MRALLALLRAPLAATAVADGVAGYLLATLRDFRAVGAHASELPHEPVHGPSLVFAGSASCLLYWAGMALNDYFDRERDRKLAPFRPIPSGKISPALALAIGLALVLGGVALALLGGGVRGALAAVGVATCVLAYDGLFKKWRLPGAVAMASCRVANVLLGAAIALEHSLGRQGAAPLFLVHAAAIGTYVFSLTLLSTYETEDAPAAPLLIGFGGALAVPVALMAGLPRATGAPFLCAHVALVLLLAAKARRGTKATGHSTTRWLIRGIFLLDAGVLAGSGLVSWTPVVLALAVLGIGGAMLLFGKPRSTPPPAPPVPLPTVPPSTGAPPVSA